MGDHRCPRAALTRTVLMSQRWIPAVAVAAALLFPSSAPAGGLSTNLGEVLVQNLGTGGTYCLKELANVTLSVVNRGDDTVFVRATPELPDTSELRQNAEPIPDATWIGIETDSMVLAPGQMGVSDVCISVPADSTLRGRKFQVMLWSRTIPRPGDFMACGLKSRVLFTVAAEVDSSAAQLAPDDGTAGGGAARAGAAQAESHDRAAGGEAKQPERRR